MTITDLLKQKGLTTGFKDDKWWVLKNITSISLYNLEGSIQNAVAYLQGIELPDGFEKLVLEVQDKRYKATRARSRN